MPAQTDKATKVLRLYRTILRTGRNWSGPVHEKDYIAKEARRKFSEHMNADDLAVDSLLEEGEQRLNYAVHYGIPYPRLHHADQFPKRYFLDATTTDLGGPAPLPQDQDAASKLAAAIARRKKKLQGREGK
eukprot:jgi/Botrbrau1/11885/Bobra.126_2s0018.1